MEVMGAIHIAVGGMEVMRAMDIARDITSDPNITVKLEVIIVTVGLIITILTLILAADILFFGEEPAFGTGQPGSRRSGSVAFTGDLALASSFCPNGKSQDGTLQVLLLATFYLTLLFQPSKSPWL